MLEAIPQAKVVQIQDAMAAIAPRLTLQLEDKEHDSLRTLLDRVISDAETETALQAAEAGP